MKTSCYLPLVKLPVKMEQTLYLIREELKSRNFFHGLQQVGLNDCYLQPHLDSLIMHSLDIDDGTDKTFEIYDDIMEKRSRKIKQNQQSITKQALKAYYELSNFKKELSRKK